jgi:hypothetical protein
MRFGFGEIQEFISKKPQSTPVVMISQRLRLGILRWGVVRFQLFSSNKELAND